MSQYFTSVLTHDPCGVDPKQDLTAYDGSGGGRLAQLSESLAQESENHDELLRLALQQLMAADDPRQLNRQQLLALHPANQAGVVQAWLQQHNQDPLPAASLGRLIEQLPLSAGPGQWDLAAGSQLSWNREWIRLRCTP